MENTENNSDTGLNVGPTWSLLGGGIPGAAAMVLQVLLLMWLRTTINYMVRSYTIRRAFLNAQTQFSPYTLGCRGMAWHGMAWQGMLNNAHAGAPPPWC